MDDTIIIEVIQSRGFLDQFQLLAVSMDNQMIPFNGHGKAYYRKNGEDYYLSTTWRDNKMTGPGILYTANNQVFAQFQFVDDQINGNCILRDLKGIVRFRGNMVNGEKDGACEEFDSTGKRVFSGLYRNGMKVPLFRVLEDVEGFGAEYNEAGKMLTLSEYDSRFMTKHGRCFVFDPNGAGSEDSEHPIPTKCVRIQMGKVAETIATFEGCNTMRCFANGKCVYEGGFLNDYTQLFCKEGNGKEYSSNGSILYEGPFKDGEREWTIEDSPKASGWKVLTNGNGVVLKEYQVNHEGGMDGWVYDYDVVGESVESISIWKNGKRVRVVKEVKNGVMTEYNMEGKVVYRGDYNAYQSHPSNVCLDILERCGQGSEFENDGVTICYTGDFENDMREGNGMFYRNGLPVYSGEWKKNHPHGNGMLMGEDGMVICEGTWEYGYIHVLNGWLDYATRKMHHVKTVNKLPQWRKRGGPTYLSSCQYGMAKTTVFFNNLFINENIRELIGYSISLLLNIVLLIMINIFTHEKWYWVLAGWIGFAGMIALLYIYRDEMFESLDDDSMMDYVTPFYAFIASLCIQSMQYFTFDNSFAQLHSADLVLGIIYVCILCGIACEEDMEVEWFFSNGMALLMMFFTSFTAMFAPPMTWWVFWAWVAICFMALLEAHYFNPPLFFILLTIDGFIVLKNANHLVYFYIWMGIVALSFLVRLGLYHFPSCIQRACIRNIEKMNSCLREHEEASHHPAPVYILSTGSNSTAVDLIGTGIQSNKSSLPNKLNIV